MDNEYDGYDDSDIELDLDLVEQRDLMIEALLMDDPASWHLVDIGA